MLIYHDPDEHKVVASHRPCAFHEKHPGKAFAGCTCSSSYGLVKRDAGETARIKADRQRKEDDEILARAEAIRIRRNRPSPDGKV
jgi:hypothetical protein